MDVKPLVPFDLPTLFGYHYLPQTADAARDPNLLRFPRWVTEKIETEIGEGAHAKGMDVRWSEEAVAGLRSCLSCADSEASTSIGSRRKQAKSEAEEFFLGDPANAMRAIDDCLRLDVRGVHHGRYKGGASEARYEELNLFFAKMRLSFRVVPSQTGPDEVLVTACRPAEEHELRL